MCIALAALQAAAQSPYPTTSAPMPAWGGSVPPAQVPYQPTLPPGSAPETAPLPPAAVALPPPPNAAPGAVWQPYAPPAEAPSPAIPFAPPGFPTAEPLYPAIPEPSLRQSLIPPDARSGFFQKARFTATWIPRLDDDSLGWTDLRAEVMTALPFFTRENPILITPAYEVHFTNGPDDFDVPPRLHDLTMDFHIFRVYDNRWIVDLAVTPGLFADDHSFDRSDALRVNGRAVGVYAPTINVKWVLGAAYVNGGWAKIVPIAGVVYEPNEDVKYELVFPQPRVAWRLASSPVPGRDEYWAYVKAEFGNAAWAIERPDGTPDVLASRDWRVIAGLERKIIGGISYRGEVGYVFNRDLKLASNGPGEISLDNSFLLRVGLTY